jgi:ABC-type cobalamin transport system ATPase subunit
MNTASRLINADGSEVSIIDLHEKINKMPMVFENPQEKILLQKNGSFVNTLDKEQRLQPIDRGLAQLTENGLKVAVGSQKFDLTLDEIHYTSVEQNHKLTVTGEDQSIQFNLEGQSALQWQLYIKRLKAGENPVNSL